MALMPCPNKIDCEGTDFPVTNYSAEGPDIFPPYVSVIWPTDWWKFGCLSMCYSTDSQADADLCALAQQALCPPTTSGNPPTPPTPVIPVNPDTPTQVCNTAQTCTVTCPDGTVFSYTVPANLFCGTNLAALNAQAYALACQKAQTLKICLGPLDRCTCINTAYAQQVVATGGTPIAFFLENGALPPGLTLDPVTGLISGTTTTNGTYTFSVRAYVASGNHATRTYQISVLEITTTAIPSYTVGTAYSYQMLAAGGSGNYGWRIVTGTLPDGLTMSTTGLISGTPTGLSSGGTLLFEVKDSTCEALDQAFFIPRIALVTTGNVRVFTKRGFPEFVSSTGALYRTVTFSGEATQTGRTTGGTSPLTAPVDIGGARWVYSGSTSIDLFGNFTSHHRKDLYVACNNAASRPLLLTQANILEFFGYCYSGDPASCPTCPSTTAGYVYAGDWSSGNPIDPPLTLINNHGTVLTPTSMVYNSGQDLVVVLNDTAAPKVNLNGQFQTWAVLHALGNYSSVLSDEYTDADAIAAGAIFSNNGSTAANFPLTLLNQQNYIITMQSKLVTVNYSLNCSNLVVGKEYAATYELWDSDGTATTNAVTFTATTVTHVITGTVPTPASGHTITIKNARINYL